MEILGVDIGGTGIKGAIVDTEKGEMITDRNRIDTPKGAKPDDVAQVVADIVRQFAWSGPLGIGFPAAVQRGITRTAANVSDKWINLNARDMFEKSLHRSVYVLNDADAAGIAEMTFGAGRNDRDDTVAIVTLGTGIGVSLFTRGELLPNAELGHIAISEKRFDAERYTSKAARKREDLSWKEYGQRLNEYFARLEYLIWPDKIIVGGGDGKRLDHYAEYIKDVRAEIVKAEFLNEAGIVGAALAYQRYHD